MRKILIACAAFIALQANGAECTFTIETHNPVINKIINQGRVGKIDNFSEICRKLNKANARLIVTGNIEVLNNISIGWATTLIADKTLPLMTPAYGGSYTGTIADPGTDVATEILEEAIAKAISIMEIDRAINSLNTIRATIKKQGAK